MNKEMKKKKNENIGKSHSPNENIHKIRKLCLFTSLASLAFVVLVVSDDDGGGAETFVCKYIFLIYFLVSFTSFFL